MSAQASNSRAMLPTNMAKSAQVEQGADELLAIAEKRLEGLRRPNINIPNERKEMVRKALEKEPSHHLVVDLRKFVDWVGISPSFADTKRAYLTAASLSRVFSDMGIKVGSRGKGKYVSLRLVSKS